MINMLTQKESIIEQLRHKIICAQRDLKIIKKIELGTVYKVDMKNYQLYITPSTDKKLITLISPFFITSQNVVFKFLAGERNILSHENEDIFLYFDDSDSKILIAMKKVPLKNLPLYIDLKYKDKLFEAFLTRNSKYKKFQKICREMNNKT